MDAKELVKIAQEQGFDAACKAKWEAGRAEHGEEWVGDPPLYEFVAEMVDAQNYLEEAFARGHITRDQCNHMRCRLISMADNVMDFLKWTGDYNYDFPRGNTDD